MKNLFLFLLTMATLEIASCTGEKICSDPLPLEPNFTQNKYQVHEGETVTFTYTGPTQPNGVTYSWNFPGGNPASSSEKNTVQVTYNTVGFYSVKLTMETCNNDKPSILKTPSVEVVP
ncbi:MAG: PKD domain-containing protein [Chitinophagales bacterium]